ncbi:LysR family transcriptional regulator [Aliidiomarina halalkaliphila]|uniref:LysR family transcriptional regulator n=1 Tax=Aliidiomarina halalkaliphila TaxID=2593535 RepID=A0A552X5S2_9GAMM|nr:LysR substrate-binding domain-containing protein [Aliidiomarina halalkaliphila]TRW49933.1 LysR family transcriptional regulator [Aliidiomarina halalkaliphila]
MKQWQGISEFVAVAEHGSFTEAAQHLHISIAQVSRNIAELESRLGLKLLYRSTRKVSLTEEGKLYLAHCRHLVESLDQANQALSSLKQTPRGLLKITAPVYFGENKLAPYLTQFLSRYPEVELDLHLTNAKLDLIQGGYDIAIRLGTLESSSLIARRLGSRNQHVVASPAYLQAHGTPENIADLQTHQCLQGSLEHWRLQCPERGLVQFRPQGRIHCNSGPFLLQAALSGMGLVQLPDYYVDDALSTGKLIAVLPNYQLPNEGIWAVYPENRHLSAKVRHLVDFLKVQLSGSD